MCATAACSAWWAASGGSPAAPRKRAGGDDDELAGPGVQRLDGDVELVGEEGVGDVELDAGALGDVRQRRGLQAVALRPCRRRRPSAGGGRRCRCRRAWRARAASAARAAAVSPSARGEDELDQRRVQRGQLRGAAVEDPAGGQLGDARRPCASGSGLGCSAGPAVARVSRRAKACSASSIAGWPARPADGASTSSSRA